MALTVFSFLASILGIVIVILTSVYLYVKHVSFNYWRKRKVVYEEPSIPFGNFTSVFFGTVHSGELYWDLYEKYKKHRYFGTYALSKPFLVINDPELIKIVLTKEFAHFHDRNFFNNNKIDPLAGHLYVSNILIAVQKSLDTTFNIIAKSPKMCNIFNQVYMILFLMSGTKWKNLRVKLTPTFTSGKMKLLFETVNSIGNKLQNNFKGKMGQDIDIKELFGRFTTEVISASAFGIETNSLNNSDCEFRTFGKKVFEPRPVMNTIFAYAPKILEFLKMPYFDKSVRNFFVNAFEEAFKNRLKDNVRRPKDFLDLLVQLVQNGYVLDDEGNAPELKKQNQSEDGKLTILQSVAQAFVFFIAGFETSSGTASFALFELAKNPDIQEKLRTEIFEVIEKHGGLTYDSLNDMPYLTKVVNETLRLYPSVLVLNRVCTKAIDLPTTDLHIEKGTDIVISCLGLHRDPDIWPDPEKFDPERFSPENIASRHPYTYLPFGEGPRICIGMRFGLMNTKIAVIAALMSGRFEVSPETLLPVMIDPGSLIVYSPKNPLYLKVSAL